MSSAAKLHRFGKGTAAVAIAAMTVTAFGPTAFAWDVAPQNPGNTNPAVQKAAGPTVGIVDTDKGTNNAPADNHGATLVRAGKTEQAIADIRLVIPNSFRQNDQIKLRLFDRSATETNAGNSNTEAATSLGFSAAPTVSVLQAPQAHTTEVSADTESTAVKNTETAPTNPWVYPTSATAKKVEKVKPTAVPQLSPTLDKSVGIGSDIITLTVGNAANGDPNATWVVTLTALKVDLGANVTPGEMRVVPFAVNADVNDPQSNWFGGTGPSLSASIDGNVESTKNTPRRIKLYTVPAYVAPVEFTATNTNIISDSTVQSLGDLTVTEVHGAALGSAAVNNVYTLSVAGATIRNSDVSGITGKVNNGGTNEGITVMAVTESAVTFRIDNPDAVKKSDFVISGLQLSASSPGQIKFTIAGAGTNLDKFMAAAGNSPGFQGLKKSKDFGAQVNQKDIVADRLTAVGTASAGITAIGGNNRYETARKIAKEWSPLGDEAIIASGENYPDALSSGFLSQRLGAPIILTMNGSVPADTMESLRERGVRKVYIIGGESAVSKAVSDKLLATPSYMWSDSSKNLVPRGGNMEVVRLGGASRYSTNALVNMYAAAQYTSVAVVGKTTPTFGAALKTTAMIARGDDFADALTANVLTSGRNTGRFDPTGTTSYELDDMVGDFSISAADQSRIGGGSYEFVLQGGRLNLVRVSDGKVIARQTSFLSTKYNLTDGGIGIISFTGIIFPGNKFKVVPSTTGGWAPQLDNLNSLPVILTPKGELGEQAKSELSTLHIEHALVIGGESAIPDAVVKGIDGMNVTTRRLSGVDRYDTAAAVNSYAWTPSVGSSTNTTPGLGFDGGVGTVNGTSVGTGEAFLANGTRFPDALVAGPYVSRRHDAMVLTWQDAMPDPTKKFLTDNAAVLDRAIGLGLGAAVSSAVITEANRLVSSK